MAGRGGLQLFKKEDLAQGDVIGEGSFGWGCVEGTSGYSRFGEVRFATHKVGWQGWAGWWW